jgi:nitric oxide reductase NorQ protein
MLVHAGRLIDKGTSFETACEVAMVLPITDDPDLRSALSEAVSACA